MTYRSFNVSAFICLFILWHSTDTSLYSQESTLRATQLLAEDDYFAVDDSLIVEEDQQITFNLLANDTGDSLVLSNVWGKNNGHFILYNANGSLNYKPPKDLFGTDTLLYELSTPGGAKDTANVFVHILPANDIPIAHSDYVLINEDSIVIISPLLNDEDIDQSGLIITETSLPENGSVTLSDNLLSYTPNPNYFGADTIVYKARELAAGEDVLSDTIFIKIASVNDTPICLADTLIGNEDDTLVIFPLSNDSDIDGLLDSASVKIEVQPIYGEAQFDIDSYRIVYVPEPNFYGYDTLFYSVKDNSGGYSGFVPLYIEVENVNDLPIAIKDDLSIKNTDTLSFSPLYNDTDLDSSGIKVVTVLYSDLGDVAWNNDSITFSPTRFVEGTDTLVYYIVDGEGDVDSAEIYIHIIQANKPPVAYNDTVNVYRIDTIPIDVLANDSDDLSVLSIEDITWVIEPLTGQIVMFPDSSQLGYLPDTTFYIKDSAFYEIRDELDSLSGCWVFFEDTARILDNDEDGITNAVEDTIDTDLDGVANYMDWDSDNDNIPDAIEMTFDTDSDNLADYLDLDSDGDGLTDKEEGSEDIDKDGIPNYLDLDSDNDGLLDSYEGTVDSDNDQLSDYLDTDSDNDLILDSEEGILDTDNDGIANYIDLDSDNDGISDLIEQNTDVDGDGIFNNVDQDSDDDGIPDAEEGTVDTDNNGIPNFKDTDSDGDDISDLIEGTDDTDGDQIPNYVDPFVLSEDSDGDMVSNGGEDANGDGNPYNDDCDNDGIVNYVDYDDGCHLLVDASKGFSPNNDGVNDVFKIEGLDAFDSNKLSVFNQWGSLVFKVDNYGILGNPFWNGDSNKGNTIGKQLPDGVYYYLLELKKGTYLLTGYVHLIR